ncbi:hypothetical protein RJ639_040627 [Escallonia herrerae]|uniref:Homeobox domain-containing protein n=1 Tax=Escallonia herrerae TaxID=1293975 RepID=A0AA88WD91_9ASTE|nr:hypothetical protein RJ639_029501 [Escallonia herrerae]KAK3025641.1 hypothetical protein RJ639_040627 [Escallonia herrerae]
MIGANGQDMEASPLQQSYLNGTGAYGENYLNGSGVYGLDAEPVMTEAQIEELEKQIMAYTILSDQLVEIFRAASVQAPLHYHDPLLSSFAGLKFTTRQRWTPTQEQLQVLEKIFEKGRSTTPSRDEIKVIATELSRHGAITEANVYHWFQNKKARTKRKKSNLDKATRAPGNKKSSENSSAVLPTIPEDDVLSSSTPPMIPEEDGSNSYFPEMQPAKMHHLDPQTMEECLGLSSDFWGLET